MDPEHETASPNLVRAPTLPDASNLPAVPLEPGHGRDSWLGSRPSKPTPWLKAVPDHSRLQRRGHGREWRLDRPHGSDCLFCGGQRGWRALPPRTSPACRGSPSPWPAPAMAAAHSTEPGPSFRRPQARRTTPGTTTLRLPLPSTITATAATEQAATASVADDLVSVFQTLPGLLLLDEPHLRSPQHSEWACCSPVQPEISPTIPRSMTLTWRF